MVKKPITIARKSGAKALAKRIAGLTRLSAYVGVPADNADRDRQLQSMLGSASGKRKKKISDAIGSDINNAEALFLFSNGSPLRNQPARPVLEPAVSAADNAKRIADQLSASVKADLAGKHSEAVRRTQMAALAGQNAARKWFTDPRNGWAPNAPATIAGKGSDRPGIDTGAMRTSIIGLAEDK